MDTNTKVIKYYDSYDEILSADDIKRLHAMGYDHKTIFYSSFDQIKQMKRLLEDAAIKDTYNLAMQAKQIKVLTNIETISADHRNIVADDIVRRHKAQCDQDVWAAERMARQAQFRFWFTLIFGYLMFSALCLGYYMPLQNEGACGIKTMKIIFPLFNLLPKPDLLVKDINPEMDWPGQKKCEW